MIKQRYPISFSKKNEYEAKDYRFIEVTIDVLHTGTNLNKTSFTKDVINQAVPSICNTPILGYIVDKDDEEGKDFAGHEHELRVSENGVQYVYAGQSYGVIPESCNPRWVLKDDGTGTEREYLRVDGLIWTKFDDAVDIFERDKQKNHSVELTDMTMGREKNGVSSVVSFLFDGCCILSTTDPNIQPAMTGSNIVANFSVDDIAGQIRDKLNEFSAIKNSLKGESNTMDENKHIEDFATVSTTEDDVSAEESAPVAEMSVEDEAANPPVEAENTVEETSAAVEDESAATQETYSLSLKQITDELDNALAELKIPSPWDSEFMIPHYWMEDVQDNEVIVTDVLDWKLYGIPYSMNGDNVVLDFENIKRKKVTYEDWDEGEVMPGMTAVFAQMMNRLGDEHQMRMTAEQRLSDVSAEYATLKPQYDEYVAAENKRKADELAAKRTALFELMDKQLSGDEAYEALKDNTTIEFAELENQCYALLGRKSAEFSYKPNTKEGNKNVRFGVMGTQNNTDAYGGLIERYKN